MTLRLPRCAPLVGFLVLGSAARPAFADAPPAAVALPASPAPPDGGDEPALQAFWKDFERLKLPVASANEESTALEAYLDGLKARETTCLTRLPHAPALRAEAEEFRAALMRTGADLDPAEVPARIAPCGEKLDVKVAPGAERGTPFQLAVSGPGAKGGLSNAIVCLAAMLPTWRLASVESSPEGWKVSGMLQLLAGMPPDRQAAPTVPEKASGEGRRSSELRLRIAAASPAVEACEQKMTEAGINGLDALEARLEAAEALRAVDALVRPITLLVFGLANVNLVHPRSIVIRADTEKTELEIRPLAAGVALRKKLRIPLANLSVGKETYGDDVLSMHVWRKETPRSLRAQGSTTDDPAFQKLLSLMDAVRTRGSDTLSHTEPELAATMQALLSHSEALGPALDEARLFDTRREELAAGLAAQGIALDPKELKARVEACGAQLDGKPPKFSGKPERIAFKGTFGEGPFPYKCLHLALRSFALDKHVRAGKTWKLEGNIVLTPVTKLVAKPVVLPKLPEAPSRPNRTRGADAKAWRAKLLELHKFLQGQHERLAAMPLGEIDALESTYDALSVHEAWPPEAVAFENTFFSPPADLELPLWMDFSFKTRDEVRLNMAPKEQAYGLLTALKKAGCRVEKSKPAGDSIRAELDCLPPDHPGRAPKKAK